MMEMMGSFHHLHNQACKRFSLKGYRGPGTGHPSRVYTQGEWRQPDAATNKGITSKSSTPPAVIPSTFQTPGEAVGSRMFQQAVFPVPDRRDICLPTQNSDNRKVKLDSVNGEKQLEVYCFQISRAGHDSDTAKTSDQGVNVVNICDFVLLFGQLVGDTELPPSQSAVSHIQGWSPAGMSQLDCIHQK